MNNKTKWDSVASDYQRVHTLGPNEYNQRLFAFWQEEGMLRPGMRVIDLGCGVGKYGMAFAELGCEVTLLDISEKMSAMTNGTCFLTRFSAWEQSSRDAILRNLGLEPAPPVDKLAEDCASMVQDVSSAGFVPMTRTVDYDWCDRRSAEEQQDYMRRRYLSEISISDAELEKAIRPLCDADGLFTDSVQTQVLWLWWKTGEKQ